MKNLNGFCFVEIQVVISPYPTIVTTTDLSFPILVQCQFDSLQALSYNILVGTVEGKHCLCGARRQCRGRCCVRCLLSQQSTLSMDFTKKNSDMFLLHL